MNGLVPPSRCTMITKTPDILPRPIELEIVAPGVLSHLDPLDLDLLHGLGGAIGD